MAGSQQEIQGRGASEVRLIILLAPSLWGCLGLPVPLDLRSRCFTLRLFSFWVPVINPSSHLFFSRSGNSSAATNPKLQQYPLSFLYMHPSLCKLSLSNKSLEIILIGLCHWFLVGTLSDANVIIS